MSGAPWSQRSWSRLGLRAPKSHLCWLKPSIKLMWDTSFQVFSPLGCLLLMPFLIQHFMDYFSLLTLFPVSSKQPSFPSLHSSYHDFWPCNLRLFSLHKALDIFSQWKRGQWKHQHIDGASKECWGTIPRLTAFWNTYLYSRWFLILKLQAALSQGVVIPWIDTLHNCFLWILMMCCLWAFWYQRVQRCPGSSSIIDLGIHWEVWSPSLFQQINMLLHLSWERNTLSSLSPVQSSFNSALSIPV